MTPEERWSRSDWLIAAGLIAFVALVFSRAIFNRNWSFGVELDFLRQFYPARVYEVNSLARGTFPLWSPYILSGHPFFASYQTALLYPFNLLMVGLYGLAGAQFPLKAQCGFVVFHFYLAGLFTYILARDLKINRAGSAIAAVTFMLSGFMVAHAGHLNQQSAAAWIPLVFLLFCRSVNRRKAYYAVLAGLAMGVALLAGHLQSIFYLSVLLLGFVVFALVQRLRGAEVSPLFGLLALGITVAVAAAVAAVQMVPLYELIGLSTRAKVPYPVAVTASLPRWQAVNLIFPHFFGTAATTYTGGWLMWETYGYSGIVGGVLGIAALLRKPRALAVFLWVVLLAAFVLALGPGGYVWTVFFKLGLFLNRFRDPARVLVIYGFASALLAGLGADHLIGLLSDADRERFRSALRVVAAVVGAVVLLAAALTAYVLLRGPRRNGANANALLGMVSPVLLAVSLVLLLFIASRAREGRTWLTVGLVALVAFDLVALNTLWIMVEVNPDDLYGDRKASQYVASLPGEFRVETDAHTMYRSLDNGPIYGLQKASGDDSLVLKEYYEYRELILPQQAPGVQVGLFYEGALRSELLDVMNDTFFMTRQPINPRLTSGKFDFVGRFGKVFVYRNRTAMPRAWMSDALAFGSEADALSYMKRLGGLAPSLRRTALVVAPEEARKGTPERPARIQAVKGRVRVTFSSAHRLTLSVDPSCKGLLVVSEVYYPGWEAFVDGRKADTLRTDLLYRGIMLAGGQRKVEFRFRPRSVYTGAVISLSALVVIVLYFAGLLGLWSFRRRKGRIEALGDSAGAQREGHHRRGDTPGQGRAPGGTRPGDTDRRRRLHRRHCGDPGGVPPPA